MPPGQTRTLATLQEGSPVARPPMQSIWRVEGRETKTLDV